MKTEEKTEETTSACEEKYQNLFNTNRDSIAIFRIGKDGNPENFIEANPATTALFGYTKKELLSMNVMDLESISDKKRKTRINTLMANGRIDFETIIKNKKGNLRNVEIETILINYLNEPAVMNITRDITERKQVEENIRKAQENLTTILEAIPDLMFEVDLEGRIYHYQAHREDLLAVPPREFMGKLFQEVIPADAAKICTEALKEANKKGWSTGKQYSLDLPQGKHWFELSVSPIKEKGNNDRHFILLARDITDRKITEISLVENKQNLQSIFDSVIEAIYVMDESGTFIDVNKGAEKMYRYSRQELIGKTPQTVAAPGLNDLDKVQKIIQKVFENGIPISFEFWAVRKNGEVFPKEVDVNKCKYSGKDVLIATARDISERKKSEEEIRKSNERFNLIGQATNDAIWEWNLETNTLWANEIHQQLYGLTMADPVPNDEVWAQRLHSEDREETLQKIKDAMASNCKSFNAEYRFFTENKGWINVFGSTYIDRNKEGQPVRLLGSMQNITERKRAEEKLKQSEARLIEAQAVAKVGSWETDFTFTNIIWSKENGRIFGIDPEVRELTLEFFLTLVHPEDRTLVETTFVHSIKTSTVNSLEHRIITADGVEKIVEERWEILRDTQGQPYKAVGTCQDITERKLTEKLLLQSKTRFSSIINSSPVAMALNDEQQNITYLNQSFIDLFGYTLEDIPTVSDWFPKAYPNPEYRKKLSKNWKTELERVKQTGAEFTPMEATICCKNGSKKTVIISANPLTYSFNSEYLVSLYDITERKQIEESLQNLLSLNEVTLESIHNGILAVNHQGNVIKTNAKFAEMWRIPNEILSSKDDKILMNFILEQLTHPEEFIARVAELYKNPEAVSKDLIYFKDGRIFERNSKPMYIEGKAEGRVWSFLDITDQKNAEKKLIENEYRLQTILSAEPECVKMVDAQGKLLSMNSAGLKMIEADSFEQVKGRPIIDLIVPEHRDSYIKMHNRVLKGESAKMEFEVIGIKGGHSWLETSAVPFQDGENLVQLAITRDITERKQAEETLRENEEKYRGLVEGSPDGIVIYVDDKIAFINDEGLRMLGAKKREEIIGKNVLQFIHPDSLANVIQRMEEVVMDNNASATVEERFMDINGVPFDVEIKAIPTVYEHKAGVQVIVHDITKRKQSLLELNKINRVYSLISQINNLILRSKNREELFKEICRIAVTYGKFRLSWIGMLDDDKRTINTAAFAGYEDGYFTKDTERITILDEPGGRGPTGTAMREGRTVICNDIENDPMMERWRESALQRGYRSSISIPIIVLNKIIGSFNLYSEETNSFSSAEEVELLEKITQNIAFTIESILFEEDRKRTQEKIRQLSQAVEQSPVTIVITNLEGNIEYVNPKFVETTGYAFEEVIGQNPRVLKSGHTTTKEYKELWQTIASGKDWHGEFHNKKKDGSLYWESASISPIVNAQGKTTHFIAIKEDITNRKQIEKELIKAKEKAEESDRLKLAFLANMSHEIRTPMNGILGFTELLKEPKLSGDEQQEYINIIEKSGKRMLNIINDIISISKVESGQIEVSLTETNVNEQIEYIHTFFKPEAKQKGIQFNFSKRLPSKESFINTDREKLYAILTNLVKNALKFTNEGFIEFGCDKKGEYLEFFIKDSGLGISKSQKKIIFERFRQANETISRSYEGSGLGLAISKAYVEMLGGKIWVESKEGKGSTFYFTIPYNFENETKEKNSSEKADNVIKEENKIKDLKVLIVEDDAISKLLITIALKPFSKEILKVSTGFEAIEACRNNPDIDLVMMDINMPEMGGYEATKQIREFDKDLVIIAQTANGMQSDRDDAIAAGCTDYISKPINITSLGELIQKYFKK